MLGDAAPFVLGRIFGPKLLRLRLVRTWISAEALARFDRWFDRHGRLTVFVARFLTGIRVPAFFAAGSMRMSAWRFFIMDGLGVLISVPVFAGLGYAFGDKIDLVIDWVEKAERVVLWSILVGLVCAGGAWFWYHKRRSKRLLGSEVQDAFVGPPLPPGGKDEEAPSGAPSEEAASETPSDAAAASESSSDAAAASETPSDEGSGEREAASAAKSKTGLDSESRVDSSSQSGSKSPEQP